MRAPLFALACVLAACVPRAEPTVAVEERPSVGAAARAQSVCPPVTADTRVTLIETAEGGELVFVTGPSDRRELQAQARTMAELYAMKRPDRPLRWGPEGATDLFVMPDARAALELRPDGARLVVVSADPDRAGTLREHLAAQVRHLQAGECLVLEIQPSGAGT